MKNWRSSTSQDLAQRGTLCTVTEVDQEERQDDEEPSLLSKE